MSEVEFGGVEPFGEVVTADDLVNSNAHEGVMLRRTAVVQVGSPFGRGGRHEGQESKSLDLHLDRKSQLQVVYLHNKRKEESGHERAQSCLLFVAAEFWESCSPPCFLDPLEAVPKALHCFAKSLGSHSCKEDRGISPNNGFDIRHAKVSRWYLAIVVQGIENVDGWHQEDRRCGEEEVAVCSSKRGAIDVDRADSMTASSCT